MAEARYLKKIESDPNYPGQGLLESELLGVQVAHEFYKLLGPDFGLYVEVVQITPWPDGVKLSVTMALPGIDKINVSAEYSGFVSKHLRGLPDSFPIRFSARGVHSHGWGFQRDQSCSLDDQLVRALFEALCRAVGHFTPGLKGKYDRLTALGTRAGALSIPTTYDR